MIILVSSDNFIQMFIGWEGVGLVSYLLISFWYTRVEAARSALKAIGVNKIGDFGLVMAIVLIFFIFGTVDYDIVFYYSQFLVDKNFVFLNYKVNVFTAIGFWLLVAATGKSAQLGLHTWLPDAMEGPTPVSALIHAATMVTAGVYLLVRCSPVIEKTSIILAFIVFIGSTTAIFGATTALFQNDLKKIIAYSTCSQLGYMIFACGLSAYSVAMFHLVNHAFFKALLFLCAGSVIHAMSDEQDIRKMGGLAKILPFTYSVMLIGSCSLAGFPFLSGYYSKDLILEIAGSTYSIVGYYSYTMGLLAAFFTTLYSIRLTYLTFLTKTNSFKRIIDKATEPSIYMIIPLFILAILSIISGKYLFPVFVGEEGLINYSFWQNSIYVSVANMAHTADIHQLALVYKLLPTFVVSAAVILATFFYYFFSYKLTNFFFHPIGREIYYFFNKKWYFDMIYSKFIIRFFYLFGYNTMFKSIDRGLLNFVTIPVLVDGVLGVVRAYKALHSGYIYVYIFAITLSTVLIFYFFI
jgi:proton-translocating NADH-quinone oxidoreductase chain L